MYFVKRINFIVCQERESERENERWGGTENGKEKNKRYTESNDIQLKVKILISVENTSLKGFTFIKNSIAFFTLHKETSIFYI